MTCDVLLYTYGCIAEITMTDFQKAHTCTYSLGALVITRNNVLDGVSIGFQETSFDQSPKVENATRTIDHGAALVYT